MDPWLAGFGVHATAAAKKVILATAATINMGAANSARRLVYDTMSDQLGASGLTVGAPVTCLLRNMLALQSPMAFIVRFHM